MHEVTTDQFGSVMSRHGDREHDAQMPAVSVSWDDAVEFCRRLTQLPDEAAEGRIYRLPTEAEWEYACRAGTTTAYSFGDAINSGRANFGESPDAGTDKPASGPRNVGSYGSNNCGLYDMHGNVWEWCSDYFDPSFYSRAPTDDPQGPLEGTLRVLRGGAWNANPKLCRSASRDANDPTVRKGEYGFRIVCCVGDSNNLPLAVAAKPSRAVAAVLATDWPLDLSQVIASVEPSVVRINTYGPSGSGCGSGFVLDDRGTIVTNYHVIELRKPGHSRFFRRSAERYRWLHLFG